MVRALSSRRQDTHTGGGRPERIGRDDRARATRRRRDTHAPNRTRSRVRTNHRCEARRGRDRRRRDAASAWAHLQDVDAALVAFLFGQLERRRSFLWQAWGKGRGGGGRAGTDECGNISGSSNTSRACMMRGNHDESRGRRIMSCGRARQCRDASQGEMWRRDRRKVWRCVAPQQRHVVTDGGILSTRSRCRWWRSRGARDRVREGKQFAGGGRG